MKSEREREDLISHPDNDSSEVRTNFPAGTNFALSALPGGVSVRLWSCQGGGGEDRTVSLYFYFSGSSLLSVSSQSPSNCEELRAMSGSG